MPFNKNQNQIKNSFKNCNLFYFMDISSKKFQRGGACGETVDLERDGLRQIIYAQDWLHE